MHEKPSWVSTWGKQLRKRMDKLWPIICHFWGIFRYLTIQGREKRKKWEWRSAICDRPNFSRSISGHQSTADEHDTRISPCCTGGMDAQSPEINGHLATSLRSAYGLFGCERIYGRRVHYITSTRRSCTGDMDNSEPPWRRGWNWPNLLKSTSNHLNFQMQIQKGNDLAEFGCSRNGK